VAEAPAESLAARLDHRVWVDEQDHVWVIHRGAGAARQRERARAEASHLRVLSHRSAVLVFDPAGNLVSPGRPGPGYEWPEGAHGVHVDYKGNVWLGGNGKGDAHILKFTKEGKFLMQLGRYGKSGGSNDLENFGRVAKIWSIPRPTKPTSRTATPTNASPWSTPIPAR